MPPHVPQLVPAKRGNGDENDLDDLRQQPAGATRRFIDYREETVDTLVDAPAQLRPPVRRPPVPRPGSPVTLAKLGLRREAPNLQWPDAPAMPPFPGPTEPSRHSEGKYYKAVMQRVSEAYAQRATSVPPPPPTIVIAIPRIPLDIEPPLHDDPVFGFTNIYRLLYGFSLHLPARSKAREILDEVEPVRLACLLAKVFDHYRLHRLFAAKFDDSVPCDWDGTGPVTVEGGGWYVIVGIVNGIVQTIYVASAADYSEGWVEDIKNGKRGRYYAVGTPSDLDLWDLFKGRVPTNPWVLPWGKVVMIILLQVWVVQRSPLALLAKNCGVRVMKNDLEFFGPADNTLHEPDMAEFVLENVQVLAAIAA